MKKYRLRLCIPSFYEVEAENEQQAKEKASEMFKKDQHTWIKPEVLDIESK